MDTSEIKSVIQNYLTACYESSREGFREVLHDAAHVYGIVEGGGFLDRDKEAFVKYIESVNPDGAKPDFPRQDEVLSIEFTGEETAVVRLKVRVRNIMFTDILSFIRLDGKWTIISKLYSGVLI